MRKVRTVIYLEPEVQAKLQKMAEQTGAPVTELIRRAIDAYLSQRRKS